MSRSEDQSIEIAERKLSEMKKFIFTKEQLKDSPSFKCDVPQNKEMQYRCKAAGLCQTLGRKLRLLVNFLFFCLLIVL